MWRNDVWISSSHHIHKIIPTWIESLNVTAKYTYFEENIGMNLGNFGLVGFLDVTLKAKKQKTIFKLDIIKIF